MTVEDNRETDWLAAAAGDSTLAEELKTGRCRCGKLLREDGGGCKWHASVQHHVAEIVKRTRWSGVGLEAGPRGEDLELLGRFLPPDFLFAYEVLVHRGLVVGGGGVRGGAGYDESVVVGAGRGTGGLGGVKSGETERRIGTGGGGGGPGKNGSGAAVVRDEAALAMRRKIDRRLRKLAREVLLWIEGNGLSSKTIVYRCTGRKCGKFAEEGWAFCPSCGSAVGESRGPRS